MRHHNRRALSDKQNALNMFNSYRKTRVKSRSAGIPAPCHNSVCGNNKTECSSERQKMKRLKTIKQRNQIRELRTNRSSQRHQHCERGSKDKGPCSGCQDCQCSLNFSRSEKPIGKPFLSQKPSIITEGRLTSIRGLFSHEVRSVDIERLVKERKDQEHSIKEGQVAASNSSSPSVLIPHSPPPAEISEISAEGISACSNKKQKSKTLEKTDCLQYNLEATVSNTMQSADGKYKSAQTPQDTDNTNRSGSPSDQKGIQEAVTLSSSESEPVHKSFPSVKVSLGDHNVIQKKEKTHDKKQNSKMTTGMDVHHVFVNTEGCVTPTGREVLNSDALKFNRSPAIFMFSSSTLNTERCVIGNENQHRKSGLSSKEEALSRLAARLSHNLSPFPLERDCPLLTECSNMLLQHLQDRHGSQLQHNLDKLHSHISEDSPHSPLTAEHVWPTSVQNCLDNTPVYFSYSRKHEGVQQSQTVEFQTNHGSQKHCLQGGFCENVEKGAVSKKQRMQTWGIHSPQHFVTKLQGPCKDTLNQWNIKAQSQESLGAKQHPNSQMFSLHQAFTGPQSPTPWSYNCTDQIMDPFFLEPQNQVKFGSGENRRQHNTPLPLLEQWRNEPDLHFLFQDENSKRTHVSLGRLTESKACSPDTESINERQLFGASSNVSAFFPPEGFCYEPYYRFPHPSNSFNRSEKTRYTEKRNLGLSLHLPNPSSSYLP